MNIFSQLWKNWPEKLSARLRFGILLNALFVVWLVWTLSPLPYSSSGIKAHLVFLLGLGFVPAATLAWALFFSRSRFPRTRILLRVTQIHALAAACLGLASCVESFTLLTIRNGFGGLGLASAIFVFVDLILLAFIPHARTTAEEAIAYRGVFLFLVGGVLTAVIVWSFSNIGIVAWRAQAIAQGRPYCLQIESATPAAGLYRPVRSLVELNGLKMRAQNWVYHATLIVQDGASVEWTHWSYWAQNFLPIDPPVWSYLKRHKPSCEPRLNYISGLPFIG